MCGPADLSLPKWRNSPYLQPYLTSELYLYMFLPQSHLKTCSFSALNILYQNSLTKPTKKKQASPNWSWHWYTPYVFMNLKKGYLKFLFVDIFAKYGVIEDRWVCGLFCCSFPHFEATIKKFQMIQLNGHITYKKNKYIKKHFLTVSSFSFSVSALHVQVNCLTWNPLGPQGPSLRAKLLCPTSFGKSHRGHAAPQPHHGLRQASLTPSPPLPGEAIRWVCLKAGVAHTPLVSTQFLFIRNSDVKLSDTSSLSFYWK